MTNIIETRHIDTVGFKTTRVLVEGAVNDVAAYEARGHVSGEEAFAHGMKLTEMEATSGGCFRIPEGKYYRR